MTGALAAIEAMRGRGRKMRLWLWMGPFLVEGVEEGDGGVS